MGLGSTPIQARTIFRQDMRPENKDSLWIDTSVSGNPTKTYNNGTNEWERVSSAPAFTHSFYRRQDSTLYKDSFTSTTFTDFPDYFFTIRDCPAVNGGKFIAKIGEINQQYPVYFRLANGDGDVLAPSSGEWKCNTPRNSPGTVFVKDIDTQIDEGQDIHLQYRMAAGELEINKLNVVVR